MSVLWCDEDDEDSRDALHPDRVGEQREDPPAPAAGPTLFIHTESASFITLITEHSVYAAKLSFSFKHLFHVSVVCSDYYS